jgi:hypothetical protein
VVKENDLTAAIVGAAMATAVLMALLVFFAYRRRSQRRAHIIRPRTRVDPTGPAPTDPLLSPDDDDLDEFYDDDPEAGEGDGIDGYDEREGYDEAGGDSEGEHEIM